MKTSKSNILVVEVEETIRFVLAGILTEHDCVIREAGSAEDARSILDVWEPDVVMLDIVLPGISGLELLGEIKQRCRDIEVLMMTSNASADTAVRAIRSGAYDYLEKPFEFDEVWVTVQRALEKRTLARLNRELLQKHEKRNRELSSELSLPELENIACDGTSVREIAESFLLLVCHETGARRASVMLLDARGSELRIAASRGLPELDPNATRVPVGKGVAGRVAQSGEAIVVADLESDSRFRPTEVRNNSTSFISAPIAISVAIKSEQSILGVINLTDRESGEPFGQADAAFLESLTSQLAIALEAARRTDQLQHAYESLKETQDQLVFSERIKAVGQMATGVAHDFNNVLSVILARGEFVRRHLAAPGADLKRIDADIATIIKTALQGGEVVKRIQDYTRIRKDVPESPVDLVKVVSEAVEMTRPKWKEWCEAEGHPVELRMELSEVPQVSGNVYELTQVVGNLIFNAVEAMPSGGRLTLRTWAKDDTVRLEVEDNGTGMDDTTREHLFDPFFTTKENGQGLGTSIIYGIVTRHLGQIDVESEPGRGTRFTVSLPRMTREVREPRGPSKAIPEAKGPLRVLLVDDEKMVRETYVEALEMFGHKVTAARGGEEALDLFAPERFDVIITDLSMAGMSGLQLAAAIRRRDASIPIILLSGWVVQKEEEQIKGAGVDQVLIKPCGIEDLVQAVGGTARPRAARV